MIALDAATVVALLVLKSKGSQEKKTSEKSHSETPIVMVMVGSRSIVVVVLGNLV